jgi:hypothetical protein
MNPYATTGDGTGGVNFAVHRPEAEAFPHKGTVLAIHVTRLVSVLLSTVTVRTTRDRAKRRFNGYSTRLSWRFLRAL